MTEQTNTALIQKVYAAFGAGDIQTILDNLASDVKWTLEGPSSIPFAGTKIGPGQVREFFQTLASTQDKSQLSITDWIAQGDNVATLGRYSCVVKATGKPIDCAVAHVFTIRGGKIARFLDFVDTAQFADAYTGAATAAHS